MRLFTHNFLQCHVKGCTKDNFPLEISEAEVDVRESEYNGDFMRNYLCKLDYPALLTTVQKLELQVELPEEMPEEPEEEFLRTLHLVLFQHLIKNGKMTCRGCGHIYVIKDGIPNMLLSEDEI